MKFIADLHIHSKYSRATARNLDFENLYHAAQIKGVSVVGTGDFTYPAWIQDIESKLEEKEPGLFALKKEFAEPVDKTIPDECRNPVRFILQTEISNIYKRDNRVRKNHNLVYFPDIESVKKFNARLDGIGNIKSDGRPILGLDAEDLLSIMLEINDRGFFVPAHIWTPWFSMFGSKSGFDTMEECFGSLTRHIFAVETGLSSDPPMNWRVKDLDHVRLISNSDAHSPGYMGRNATVFDTDLSFAHIRQALEKNDPDRFQGTLDMYPHQGKYHYDGHRKCNVCLNPAATKEIEGICPVCGRKVTYGVLNRVQELAVRHEGYMPEDRHGFKSIIPLADILSEIFEVGPKTKRVATHYNRAVEALGPELGILIDRSFEDIKAAKIPLLAEAVMKMRTGDVDIDPGFDGEFGRVNLFSRQEKERLKGEKNRLFSFSGEAGKKAENAGKVKKNIQGQAPREWVKIPAGKTAATGKPGQNNAENVPNPRHTVGTSDLLMGLNPEQQKAVNSSARAMVIQAGPGTGKTRTLTAKIAHLISNQGIDPGSILALTFTNKAAREVDRRIHTHVPQRGAKVFAATFHGFCLTLLKEYAGFRAGIVDDSIQKSLIREALGEGVKRGAVNRTGQLIGLCKQGLLGVDDDLSPILIPGQASKKSSETIQPDAFRDAYRAYQALCQEQHVVDFEDLIFMTITLLRERQDIRSKIQKRFAYIFIDEYQDLNFGQYELVKLISRQSHILVIGDPDQSIYGFRGSDNKYFKSFEQDFPGCEQIFLNQNYRSTQTILDASFQMISRSGEAGERTRIFSDQSRTRRLVIKEAATEQSEALAVGRMIENLMGGTSFFSMDTGKSGDDDQKEYSFADFAVLVRTSRQTEAFIRMFEQQGIPYQAADKKKWMEMDGIRQLLCICRVMAGCASLIDFDLVFDHFTAGLGNKERFSCRGAIKDAWARQADVLEILASRDMMAVRGEVAQKTVTTAQTLFALRDEMKDKSNESGIEILCRGAGLSKVIEADDKTKQGFEKLLAIARLHPDLKGFLDGVTLNQDPDVLEFNAERVSLMTMHAAKGLEFPVVFVAGCEQGLVPFARDNENIDDIEEERRLFYVAMTRAMDILCLTYAGKRSIYGSIKKRQRSFFIEDIEKKLTRMEKRPVLAAAKKRESQLELF
jgi:uncharacterized protein (TIGR00375 family)